MRRVRKLNARHKFANESNGLLISRAIRDVFDFQVAQLRKLMPQATWTGAGIGAHQLEVNRWSLELGGHCRTGLEDNIRFDKSRLAASNVLDAMMRV